MAAEVDVAERDDGHEGEPGGGENRGGYGERVLAAAARLASPVCLAGKVSRIVIVSPDLTGKASRQRES